MKRETGKATAPYPPKAEKVLGRVFLACAIGAGIGSLVALEMARAFWWIGLLVGGLTGYLSYEWRAVLRAIPAAYRAARGWQSEPFFWPYTGWTMLLIASVIFDIFLIVGIPQVAVGNELPSPLALLVIYGSMTTVVAALVISASGAIGVATGSVEVAHRNSAIEAHRKGCYAFAPPLVLFWHLPRGIWWVARRLPRAMIVTVVGIARGVVAFARFMKRFAWELFLRIHSEMRLLCGVDAMLGAAVGYFAGSAIIGALAGGIFGVLNYAIVTERWLKPKGYLPTHL